jgi:hypothetical protein
LWFEVVHDAATMADTFFLPSVGLNIHFTPSVLLKTQYMYAMLADMVVDADRNPSSNNVSYIASRFVVSF